MKIKLRGFSLIELILSLAILSISIYLIGLNSKILTRQQEKAELSSFASSISSARTSSLASRKRDFVKIDYSSNSYYLSTSKETIFLDSLVFDQARSNRDLLEFTSGGRPAFNTAGTIHLKGQKSDKEYKLTISPVSGKVSISNDGVDK